MSSVEDLYVLQGEVLPVISWSFEINSYPVGAVIWWDLYLS